MIGSFVHDVPASRVVFGPGTIAEVGAEVERLGTSRVILVVSPSARAAGERVADDLGARVALRVTDTPAHVPTEAAERTTELARESGGDAIVAIGGGSAVGMAKAVARRLALPIVAVPTTYAGSEMTPIWGETADSRKHNGRDLLVLPRTVVYDPDLTMSLPPDVSAASGMNALAHLVEGLYAPGTSPLQTLQAVEGVRALAAALPVVVQDPTDQAARAESLYGAWLAGWTLGTTGMGVHHKICHVIGGAYGLPHAGVHSALLAYSAQFNATAAPEAMAAIVRGLHAAGRNASDAAAGIWDLARDIGAPTSLTEVGLDMPDVDDVAALVVEARPVNPRPVDVDGVRQLLLNACAGERPGSSESVQVHG